jgi:hypothetical protein
MDFQRKVCGIPSPLAVTVVCLIFVYLYVFGRPTMFIWSARQEAAHDPKLALVPTPLPDTSVSTTPGTTVTFFGYQFEVPWQGPVAVKNPGNDYLAVAYSDSIGKPLMFFNPANDRGMKITRQELKAKGQDPSSADVFLNAHSDYDVERSVLYATPAQLSLVFPSRKDVWVAAFLTIKQSRALGADTGLYSLEFGQLRGFQMGDPSRARNVRVEVFDRDDREFEFGFGCKPDPEYASKQGFGQRDINRVLQTLRPARTP